MTQNESGAPEQPSTPVYGDLSHPEERKRSMLVHLSALIGVASEVIGLLPFTLLAFIIPTFVLTFTAIFAPLMLWLIYREESNMVDHHGKQALNFQISMVIYWLALNFTLPSIGLFIPPLVLPSLPFLLLTLPLLAVWIIWTILAGVRARRGEPPGYILAIRFVR